ncbi:MAG: DNA polymerase [Candidatus Paceibacterota bacterium]|jgi:DNA polymerase-1
MENNKKVILLDAHAIIHRAYHALPDFTSSKGEATGAIYGLSTMLIKIINDLKPDYIFACYDMPQKTFRHEAYDAYKAGRKKADDNLVEQLKSSRLIFDGFSVPIFEKPGFEADDLLGTIAYELRNKKDIDVVIASGDMDTLQLVDGKKVQVYTLKKGISDTILYDEKGVVDRFQFLPKFLPDYKGLRGDPSDNIIGIKGIGEKTASILIKEFGTIENLYKKLKKDEGSFEKLGMTKRIIGLLKDNEEEALFSKTLAQIRLDAPIDFSLPKETWKESFDIRKAESVFKEFEFKSLIDRVSKIFGDTPQMEKSSNEEDIDKSELEKVSIALWLLNSDTTNPDLKDILEYGNTELFEVAKDKILKELKEKNLEYVYNEIELPIIEPIKKMEEKGILVDKEYLKKLSWDYHRDLSVYEKKIWNYAGDQFNINSPKQLGEVLFDKLQLKVKGLKKSAGGARSTRISELERLKGIHPIIDEIISYREIQKLLSTYIDPMPKMLDDNNRLHTHFIQTGTTTGRFSSVNPNLQNIPTRSELGKKIRKVFIVDKGYKLLTFDYSQIELRVLALLSQDELMLKVFNDGKDIHSSVASRVFGVKETEVTSEMRRRAKIINFGIVYGMGINALKENLKSTREDAEIFYENYFKQFPKIFSYLESIKTEAGKKGYTETIFGRRRYFPAIKSKIPYLRAMAERMAVNAPIQGTASDLIKLAIKNSVRDLKESGLTNDAFLLLQVHDELVFEVKEDKIKEVRRVVRKAMESVLPTDILGSRDNIPMSVDIAEGKNWGELEHL